MSYVIDPSIEQQVDETLSTQETISQSSMLWYFEQCQENRDLLSSIEVVVPVRPNDGMACALARMTSVWYGEGTPWSQLNDHMGGFIEMTRANIAYDFVHRKRPKNPKYLLMIDNDMHPPVNLPYLLARHDLPIVSGVAVHVHGDEGPRACFTVKCEDGEYRFPQMRKHVLPKSGVMQCGHVGTGAILIRRDVLESFTFEGAEILKRIQECLDKRTGLNLSYADLLKMKDSDIPFYVPERLRESGARVGRLTMGEDLAFCEQARAKGFDCHVDMEARCGHAKFMVMEWPEQRMSETLDATSFVMPNDGNAVRK